MNIAIWLVQVLVAIFFLINDFLKTFLPIADLSNQLPWVLDMPEALVRFIGIVEISGGLGVVLPAITRILPWVTIAAAGGLGFHMALAVVFHIYRGEFPNIILPVIILALAAIIAYGRWKVAPINSRT